MGCEMEKEIRHAFVICAFGESRYLTACICSLLDQTVKSRILIVTSTPNDFIRGQAERYGIPLFVAEKAEEGVASDWNFGYRKAREIAEYVTIAHQDDIYLPEYTEILLSKLTAAEQPLIAFCNYAELRNERVTRNSLLLSVKRLMLLPLKLKRNRCSVRIRRSILSLGNPIMCPTALFCTENLPDEIFTPGFISNSDWEAWEKLSVKSGSFVYEPRILFLHRIHKASTTTAAIQSRVRRKEDLAMFQQFWPEKVAKWIAKIYGICEKNNEV